MLMDSQYDNTKAKCNICPLMQIQDRPANLNQGLCDLK